MEWIEFQSGNSKLHGAIQLGCLICRLQWMTREPSAGPKVADEGFADPKKCQVMDDDLCQFRTCFLPGQLKI